MPESIARNNDQQWMTTKQFATPIGVKPETALRAHSVAGHYMGIIPIKLPNNQLRWPPDSHKRLGIDQ